MKKIQAMEKAQNPEGSGLKRFATGIASSLDPRGLIQAVASPVEALKGLVSARDEQAQKSGEAFGKGRYVESFGHGMAAALPVIGPGAAAIGEQIGSGDVAGGMGAAMTSVLPVGALAGARLAKVPVAGARAAKIPAAIEALCEPRNTAQALRTYQGNYEAPLRSCCPEIDRARGNRKPGQAAENSGDQSGQGPRRN